MSKDLLLIEDDKDISLLIKEHLDKFGFNAHVYANPIEALEFLKENPGKISLVILDLTLPGMDGFEVLEKIKTVDDIPVIISSARGDMNNKIHGYEIGADDYLAKPYEPRELVLRVEAVLKRFGKNEERVADFIIKDSGRSVELEGFKIDFTKVESEIFFYLIKNRNKIISREQLVNATSLDSNSKNRTIDMHISNIRYKIGDDSKNPRYIKSIWGIGYKFIG